MSDEPFYSPRRKPPAPRQPVPGELVWELHARGRFYRCELRTSEFGVEAQILIDSDLLYAQRFDTRSAALAFAEIERETRARAE